MNLLRLLFSNKIPKKSGPKGPSQQIVNVILEMKKRNPQFGSLRIAIQIQHAFIERLIGSIRREYLNRLLFWNERDLQNKLNRYKKYYNIHRAHSALDAKTPSMMNGSLKNVVSINDYGWKQHGNNLFQLPMAA